MKINTNFTKTRSYWQKQPQLAHQYHTWLVDSGSLTARLQRRYPHFLVKPIALRKSKPFSEESFLLDIASNQHALIREVLLMNGQTPVVFAHSVLPISSLTGIWQQLGSLGNKPLGAALFANPRVKRTPLSYKKLTLNHPLYQKAITHLGKQPPFLWARRSIFSLHTSHQKCAKILVTEVFLPHLLNE